MQITRAQRYWAVTRDVLSFVLGAYIILDQEITQHVNLELLLAALALLGTPGAIALVNLFLGSAAPKATTESSPPPAPQPLPSQPSSSS